MKIITKKYLLNIIEQQNKDIKYLKEQLQKIVENQKQDTKTTNAKDGVVVMVPIKNEEGKIEYKVVRKREFGTI